MEIRGSGQETDEDYFETQSHQSESFSDIKTEPYESVSDSESIASDLTRDTNLSSNCFSSEIEEPWLNFFETKVETVPSQPLCTRQHQYTQKQAAELLTVLQTSPDKDDLEIQRKVSKPEEADGKNKMLPYSVPHTKSEDFILKTEATLVEATKCINQQGQVQISPKNLDEGAIAKGNTRSAATKLACVRANSESSLTFPETQCTPIPREIVSRYSLPDIHLETDRTWKRNCEAFSKFQQDYIPSSQHYRKNIMNSKQVTVPHLSGKKLKMTDLPYLNSKFQASPQRRGDLEMKSWHSSPENISAQEDREHTNNCICLGDKLSWSCSRLHLASSDYENVCENLGQFDYRSQNLLKTENNTGTEILNTHLDSDKNSLTHMPDTNQVSSANVHNKFKTCSFTAKGADVFADSMSMALSKKFEHDSKQEITLECISANINANVILRTDQSILEDRRGIHGLSQELSGFEIHNGEFQGNSLGGHIMDNCDNSCEIHASTISEQLDMERNCLECQNNEAFLGVSEIRKDWEIMDGVPTSSGRDFTVHQGEKEFQNISRRSSTFKCPSDEERTDDHLVGMQRENYYSGDVEDVSALEISSRSHNICREGKSGQVSELKSISIQPVGQNGLQYGNMGGEKCLIGLTADILQCEDLTCPLIPMKDVQELQEAPKAQSHCGGDILPAHVISDGRDGFLVRQESAKPTNDIGEATFLDFPPLFDCAASTETTTENDLHQNHLSLGSWCNEGNVYANAYAINAEMEPCQINVNSDFETAGDNLKTDTRGHVVVHEIMATNIEQQNVCVTMTRRQEINGISCHCTEVTVSDKTLENDVPRKHISKKENIRMWSVPNEKTEYCDNSPRSELNRSFSLGDSRCISRDSELKLSGDVHEAPLKIDISTKTSLDNISTGSTNSEETDENVFSFQGSNSSFYKAVQKNNKTRVTEKSPKHSKFLSFSKMASFRKTKPLSIENQANAKNKTEELGREEEGEIESSTKSPQNSSSNSAFHSKDNCLAEYSDDDDLFYERSAGAFNRISLRKASSSGRTLLEDVGASPTPKMVRSKYCEGKVLTSVENNESAEYPEMRKSSSENDFKRNKNTETNKFRTRLALAHRSFSSFFESKSLEKENAEQSPKISMKNEKEKNRLHQTSWKAFLKSKEADGLKRPDFSSLPTQQSPCTRRSPGSFARRASKEKLDCHSGQVRMNSGVSNGSSTEAGHSDSSGTSDFMPLDGRRRRRNICHEYSVNCPHSPEYNEKEGAMGNDRDVSFEEFWLKSPVSPVDLQSSFSHFTPSCPQLSMYERRDMPCRPMSPKPQSPRTSSRKGFHYPGRLSSTSMISLGNISAMDSNLEAPERPKTLKPRSSFLLSMHSLDNDYQREDSGISSQSQISLNTASSVSDIIRDTVSCFALVVVGL